MVAYVKFNLLSNDILIVDCDQAEQWLKIATWDEEILMHHSESTIVLFNLYNRRLCLLLIIANSVQDLGRFPIHYYITIRFLYYVNTSSRHNLSHTCQFHSPKLGIVFQKI